MLAVVRIGRHSLSFTGLLDFYALHLGIGGVALLDIGQLRAIDVHDV